MIDKRQLIESLTICINDECDKCVYKNKGEYCSLALLHDTREQLMKQTAQGGFTVIDTTTGQEADTYDIALHEDWAKHLVYCDINGWAITDDGDLILIDDCGRFAYADRERFKVIWDVNG